MALMVQLTCLLIIYKLICVIAALLKLNTKGRLLFIQR